MKKFSIPIVSSDKDTICKHIQEVLLPILQWYNPHNHSDLYYIRVVITSDLAITLKMVMPFSKKNTVSSYTIYSYTSIRNTIDHDEMLVSASIRDSNDLTYTCKGISDIIAQYTIHAESNEILVTTNLDADTYREQRGFVSLYRNTNKSMEELFIDFIYDIGQNLNEHVNYALMRLDICINPNTDEEIKGSHEAMIHCSNAFDRTTYDISCNIPQSQLESVFGLSFEELTDNLYEIFELFKHKGEVSCLNDDTFDIKYFIIKKEVAY